jgi:hypothetical protein
LGASLIANSAPSLAGLFVFDVPQRLQRIVGSSANKTLVRGGCLDRLGEAETTVTRTFQIA